MCHKVFGVLGKNKTENEPGDANTLHNTLIVRCYWNAVHQNCAAKLAGQDMAVTSENLEGPTESTNPRTESSGTEASLCCSSP